MALRMGPVQSTSSVAFLGMEIIGELCAEMIDMVVAGRVALWVLLWPKQ